MTFKSNQGSEESKRRATESMKRALTATYHDFSKFVIDATGTDFVRRPEIRVLFDAKDPSLGTMRDGSDVITLNLASMEGSEFHAIMTFANEAAGIFKQQHGTKLTGYLENRMTVQGLSPLDNCLLKIFADEGACYFSASVYLGNLYRSPGVVPIFDIAKEMNRALYESMTCGRGAAGFPVYDAVERVANAQGLSLSRALKFDRLEVPDVPVKGMTVERLKSEDYYGIAELAGDAMALLVLMRDDMSLKGALRDLLTLGPAQIVEKAAGLERADFERRYAELSNDLSRISRERSSPWN